MHTVTIELNRPTLRDARVDVIRLVRDLRAINACVVNDDSMTIYVHTLIKMMSEVHKVLSHHGLDK